MTTLDTNVIVRFVTRDDPVQGPLASAVFANLDRDRPGFVCRETLVELVWVLGHTYKYERSEIARVLEMLLASSELVIEDAEAVGTVVDLYGRRGFDFADLMIRQIARQNDALPVVTFDAGAARLDGIERIA